MIINGDTRVRDKHQVWSLLDSLKPDAVITRVQNGVDSYAYAWGCKNGVRTTRLPLSSMVKHLMSHKPDVVLDFGAGSDRTAYDFLRVAKAAQDCKVIPVSY